MRGLRRWFLLCVLSASARQTLLRVSAWIKSTWRS